MRELGPSSPEEMVLAFLRAEIESARFGHYYNDAIAANRLDPDELIRRGDIADARQNALRAALLGAIRGYAKDARLFPGFPTDATWIRVELEADDAHLLRYADYPDWVDFSNGTRLVLDGAAKIATATLRAAPHIRAIADRVRCGDTFPELIAARSGDTLVLIEGHSRATAYAICGCIAGKHVLVASSPRMSDWKLL